MSKALDAVIDGVKDILSGIKNWFSDMVESGKGLISAFTDCIKEGFGKAVTAVKDGLKKVRDFLLFSPAKKVPLSDLDKSGESFVLPYLCS